MSRITFPDKIIAGGYRCPFKNFITESFCLSNEIMNRKEKDLKFSVDKKKNPLKLSQYKNKNKERASASTRKKGSITVEAAMAVPIFFFATLALIYLFEMMTVQTSVRCGLQEAGKKLAVQAAEVTAVFPTTLEKDIVNSIGSGRLERSIVEGGSSGIDCSRSYLSPVTGIGEIQAAYKLRIPVPFFSIAPVTYKETIRIKAWTGYEAGGFGEEDDEIVYVTDTGMVYHKDAHCTHLDLSIRAENLENVGNLRNESGGKYHVCEKCVRKNPSGGNVYITDQGDRYHTSLTCSGLKRTVYTVRISEVPGKRACSKCGK